MAPPARERANMEVRCAGCGETLEVEEGLTEFICPDCATPQSLPPELMPPRRRRALPLPRGFADARGVRLPCAACGTLLAVSHGIARFACPICAVELAVDRNRLRNYLAAAAAVTVVAPPSAVPLASSPAREAQSERSNHANNVEQVQVECHNYPICVEQAQVELPSQVIHVEKAEVEPLNHGIHRKGRAELLNGTITRHTMHKTRYPIDPKSISVVHTQVEHPNQVIDVRQAQEKPADDAIDTEQVQVETHNEIITRHGKRKTGCSVGPNMLHASRRQENHANDVIHTEQVQVETHNETMTRHGKRKSKCLVDPNVVHVEQLQVEAPDQVFLVQQAQEDTLYDAIPIEQVQDEPRSKTAAKQSTQKVKGSMSCSPLRRSKRLAKEPVDAVESELIQQQATSPTPIQSQPPDIRSAAVSLSNSSSHEHQTPQASSDESDHLDVTKKHASSHIGKSQAERIAQRYCQLYPPEVRRALAKLSFKSWHEHQMPQASSDETHKLVIPESQERQNSSQPKPTQRASGPNAGAKQRRKCGRGPTLCLEVWRLPEGERIKVFLNTVGQPVGREASMLSNFLGTIARDGKLAPLTYENWRLVPAENKEIMWHIVKLKFDIDPAGECWVLKSLGIKWKDWKSTLKREHYDVHKTDKDRLDDRDPRVQEEQWPILVSYWSSEKAMAQSARNRANRACLETTHTAGTKSFARIREEERQKRPNKDDPSCTDVFILTHTRKDRRPVNRGSCDITSCLREQALRQPEEGSGSSSSKDDVFAEVMGKERKSSVRTYGPGPCPAESLRRASEARKRAEEEASAMRKKMMAMEESYKKLQEEMASMKSTVSAMHRMLSVDDLPDERGGELSVPPGFMQHPIASSPPDDPHKLSERSASLHPVS